MGIIGSPLLTHEEVIRRTYRLDQFIGTVCGTAWIVSIADILSMLRSIDHDGIYATSYEPVVDHCEIIVAIAWISPMMILSLSFRELDIPVLSCLIQTRVVAIWWESEIWAGRIVPLEPFIADFRSIDILELIPIYLRRSRVILWNWIYFWWSENWIRHGGVRYWRFYSFSLLLIDCDSRSIVLFLLFDEYFFLENSIFLHLDCQRGFQYEGSRLSKRILRTEYEKHDAYPVFHGRIVAQCWIIAKKSSEGFLLVNIASTISIIEIYEYSIIDDFIEESIFSYTESIVIRMSGISFDIGSLWISRTTLYQWYFLIEMTSNISMFIEEFVDSFWEFYLIHTIEIYEQ